jgi:hypothetical protein
MQKYIQSTSTFWTLNQQRIQGLSEFCGYYCILCLLFKCRGNEREFFQQFKSNYDFNDDLIDKLIKKFD